MLLAIDVGNTDIVFGIFNGALLEAKFRLSTETVRTADEIGLMVAQFCRHFGFQLEDLHMAVVGSVVPPIMYTLKHALRKYLDAPVRVVGDDLAVPLENLCEEPLGVDRAVTGVAAMAVYGAPCIVIDFGTATKADVFSPSRAYLGGLILPGIKISMDALFARAAKLPRVEIKKPRSIIGVNTVEQMQAGAVYGFVGSVEGIVAGIKRELGCPGAPVVATGGLARLIASHTESIDFVDENLTLQGLRIVCGQGA